PRGTPLASASAPCGTDTGSSTEGLSDSSASKTDCRVLTGTASKSACWNDSASEAASVLPCSWAESVQTSVVASLSRLLCGTCTSQLSVLAAPAATSTSFGANASEGTPLPV